MAQGRAAAQPEAARSSRLPGPAGMMQPACVIMPQRRAESLRDRKTVSLSSCSKCSGMTSWPELIPRKLENTWICECEPDSQSRQSAKY